MTAVLDTHNDETIGGDYGHQYNGGHSVTEKEACYLFVCALLERARQDSQGNLPPKLMAELSPAQKERVQRDAQEFLAEWQADFESRRHVPLSKILRN